MKLASKCLSIFLMSHIPFSFQLECYTCMSRFALNYGPPGKEELLPNECPDEVEDWPTKKCKEREVCYFVEFTIKEARYVVRGCNNTIFCGFHCKNKNDTLEKLNKLSHLYCFVCDKDFCNSATKNYPNHFMTIWSLMGFVFLLAMQDF